MNGLTRLAASLTAAAMTSACAATGASPPRLTDFKVIAHGFETGAEFCGDFRLTPAQARWFFERAHVYTAREMHDRFDELPCWVRGTARAGASIWRWEVRAGGSANLTSPAGDVLMLGCNTCDEVLGAIPAIPSKR